VNTAEDVKKCLSLSSRKEKIAVLSRFFKTGPGEYSEGDVFIGVTVPEIRKVAQQYRNLALQEVRRLLADPVHEHRLAALLILVEKTKTADDDDFSKIVNLYCASTRRINNWDLVDLSAPKILGPWLLNREKTLLYEFAASNDLWKQRIAMVATHHFIIKGDLEHTFTIADMLIGHRHDLIHKAAGWMLREAGKRDESALRRFLLNRYRTMPRTMLRYAIEKFSHEDRQNYLRGKAE
jgi:3-methyladenine DNA glycosylase AlkD